MSAGSVSLSMSLNDRSRNFSSVCGIMYANSAHKLVACTDENGNSHWRFVLFTLLAGKDSGRRCCASWASGNVFVVVVVVLHSVVGHLRCQVEPRVQFSVRELLVAVLLVA